jgi:hypothetical protein
MKNHNGQPRWPAAMLAMPGPSQEYVRPEVSSMGRA